MNKRFEAGVWGAEPRKANSGRRASAGSSGRRKQIAKAARSISAYQSNKTQSMGDGTVYCPAALLFSGHVLLVCNGFPRRGHYANILHGKAVRFLGI
jgi:hypothetical protein